MWFSGINCWPFVSEKDWWTVGGSLPILDLKLLWRYVGFTFFLVVYFTAFNLKGKALTLFWCSTEGIMLLWNSIKSFIVVIFSTCTVIFSHTEGGSSKNWGWCSDHLYFNMKIYLISRINSLFNEKDLIQILMHGPFYLREKGYYASFDSSWWEKHSGGCNAVWSQYLNPNQKLLQKKKLLVSSGDLKWPEAHLPEVRPGHCFRLNHQQGPKISCFWTFWVIWMAFRGSWNFSHWLNIMGRSAKWPDLRSPI